jgi:N-acetylmuramoyl-L-alanine amidase
MSLLKNSISQDGFSSILGGVKEQTNISEVSETISNLSVSNQSTLNSVVAKNANTTVANIESLTSLSDTADLTSIPDIGPVRLKNPIEGFFSAFTTIPTNTRALQAITGKAPVLGNLKSHVIASSPFSIFSTIGNISGIDPNNSLIGQLTTAAADTVISNIKDTTRESSFANSLASATIARLSSTNNFDGGILTNLLLLGTDVLRNELVSNTNGLLRDSVLNRAMQEIVLGRKENAVNIIQKELSSLPNPPSNIDSILKSVYRIDPSISNVVASRGSQFTQLKPATTKVERLNSNEQNFPISSTVDRGVPSAYEFKFVDSFEELIADFRGTNREITETVVHWTAHYTDQGHVGSEELHNIAVNRGFSGCSYHYIIKRDGSLQRGRPLNRIGAHAKANGHNKYSIGVSMVGGYNCNSGNPHYNKFISAESITSEQWNTLDQFLRAFYVVWPGGQVWGHNDTDPESKVDPGIDMQEYIQNKFKKKNKSASGTLPPLSPSELVGASNTNAKPS